MASSLEKRKREAEEAIETLEHIRMVGEEVRDDPELLFWCPNCGLPGSRSTGEWAECRYHPGRMVSCGLPACWRRVHHCRVKVNCRQALCEECAKGTRQFAKCHKCCVLVCDDHSNRMDVGYPERVCRDCE